MEKTTREKIQDLKSMINNPRDFDYTGDPERDVPWEIDDWKDHVYGSCDPADLDEQFVSNLSEYCFRSVNSLTDIVSDLNQSVERLLAIKEIGTVLTERPDLMKLFENLHSLDAEDVGFVSDLVERLAAKEEEELIGMIAERIAHLQNVIDDLIFTNRLELTIDHSDDTLKNKEKIENFKEDVKKWNEENQN